MKKTNVLCGMVAGLLSALIFVRLFGRYRKKIREEYNEEESLMKSDEMLFEDEWSKLLADEARTFNGLYGGLIRIVDGTAGKPERILREWCKRTHYKWENHPVDLLCQRILEPLIEEKRIDELKMWAGLLLSAVQRAGIRRDEKAGLLLSSDNVDAYIEWNDSDLYEGDSIEIITPAWYQNGLIIEQGLCKKGDIV